MCSQWGAVALTWGASSMLSTRRARGFLPAAAPSVPQPAPPTSLLIRSMDPSAPLELSKARRGRVSQRVLLRPGQEVTRRETRVPDRAMDRDLEGMGVLGSVRHGLCLYSPTHPECP
jgi:hypothetical protein